MKDLFSVEETNLMCIHGTSDKTTLIADLRDSLPNIKDTDMRDIYDSTIEKLEKISDSDFAEIGFYIADDYSEETEA